MRVGWTPMYRAERLASSLGLKNFSSKMMDETPPRHLKIAPAQLWWRGQKKLTHP